MLKQRGLDFHCTIAGSGPLKQSLQQLIDSLGLADRVKLTGTEIKQEEIPAFMAGGDVYCLPCVWASDNDVDGLPQMLMEAMACGLPAISTRLVGIPDLVIDGRTGLLVEPNNVEQLADAIEKLHRDPDLAARLVRGADEHLRETFDLTRSLDPLIDQFRQRLGPATRPAPSAARGAEAHAAGVNA
jgi:glycosyltransferase involved in cell wall biosynthesis